MRVIDIVPGTTVDGPGLRTAIYFAGCRHRCPGCHNPQSWSEEAGREMEIDDILAVVDENGFDVTFSGGDPMFQAEELYKLARRIKESGRNIWCYTGYLYE
ncbi:MAG: radical SAM protein, partial [Duncaniella sp.]|nr:radical SAM protein [Duncaniella sp.]